MDYFKIITLNNKRLAVYKTGEIVFWDTIKNHCYNKGWNIHNSDNSSGYSRFFINSKRYKLSRIIGYAFLGLDIDNKTQIIDHIDGNTQNDNLENLRIVSHQGNQWNRHNEKGYCKDRNKFRAMIRINYKRIYLGSYDTEEEAKNAYLQAKEKYHII